MKKVCSNCIGFVYILMALFTALVSGPDCVAADAIAFPQVLPPSDLLKVPKVDLDFWNSDGTILFANNCYNYSTNRATNTFAQPGESGNVSALDESGHLTCDSVRKAVAKDEGVEETGPYEYLSLKTETLIALVVWPDQDYHWYRKGPDGSWTHKPGGTPATDRDSSGKPIKDVEMADRSPYTEFCGYFRVKNFPVEEHEQNSGYVRIGQMLSKPDLGQSRRYSHLADVAPHHTDSTIERLLYSGMQNPKLSLAHLIQNGRWKKELREVAEILQLRRTLVVTSVTPSELTNLGYRGLLIEDQEGLIFPKGSKIQIKGKWVSFTRAGSHGRPEIFKLHQPIQLEKQLEVDQIAEGRRQSW